MKKTEGELYDAGIVIESLIDAFDALECGDEVDISKMYGFSGKDSATCLDLKSYFDDWTRDHLCVSNLEVVLTIAFRYGIEQGRMLSKRESSEDEFADYVAEMMLA